MGRCSVFGCRMKNDKNNPNISLHRLPASKERKKQWLDILGIETLNTATKYIFICSLHFEDNCFNRTLNVTRLRDDALPSREFLLPARFDKCEQPSVSHRVMAEKPICRTSNNTELTPQFHEQEEQLFVSHKVVKEKPACSISSFADLPAQLTVCEERQSFPRRVFEKRKPFCSTTNNNTHVKVKALEIINKLKSKCEMQKKKIKRLNEKVRRKNNKITDLKSIIKDLIDNNYVNDDDAAVL